MGPKIRVSELPKFAYTRWACCGLCHHFLRPRQHVEERLGALFYGLLGRTSGRWSKLVYTHMKWDGHT